MNKSYIEIGKIVNTFGIKGELKVQSESDFVEYRYRKTAKIYLKMGRNMKEVEVTSFRFLKGNAIITIDHLQDINDVKDYIGAIVFADATDVPPLNEGEYMIDDLVGLNVVDEDNKRLGIVKDVIILPTQDILEIDNGNPKPLLIPFIDEYIISIENDTIVVKLYEVAND